MLERVWRKGSPPTLLVGMQTSTATMENSVEIPLKIANGSLFLSHIYFYYMSFLKDQTFNYFPYFQKSFWRNEYFTWSWLSFCLKDKTDEMVLDFTDQL